MSNREMRPKWVVWREGGGPPTCLHDLQAVARSEAERLARLHGGRFYVARIEGACERRDVTWTEVDDLPW